MIWLSIIDNRVVKTANLVDNKHKLNSMRLHRDNLKLPSGVLPCRKKRGLAGDLAQWNKISSASALPTVEVHLEILQLV